MRFLFRFQVFYGTVTCVFGRSTANETVITFVSEERINEVRVYMDSDDLYSMFRCAVALHLLQILEHMDFTATRHHTKAN